MSTRLAIGLIGLRRLHHIPIGSAYKKLCFSIPRIKSPLCDAGAGFNPVARIESRVPGEHHLWRASGAVSLS